MNSLQDLSIIRTATITGIPEGLVELVIAHKNKAMYEALYLNRSVEDSGLGKFTIRIAMVINRIKRVNGFIDFYESKLKEEDITEQEIIKYNKILQVYSQEKEYLETKI